MPELPEVETVRLALVDHVVGRSVQLTVHDARWSAPGVDLAVSGRSIVALTRRGKYLVFELSDDVFLLVHLRMTGNLLVDPGPDAPYRRVTFALSDGHEVAFCDPRRFGTGELCVGVDELASFLDARLGPEPFGLPGSVLRRLARGLRGPAKSFLLDQKRIAGVGNIYADEALWRAGVHPLRPIGSLRPAQYEALARAVEEVLLLGLAHGGASIDDYRRPDGSTGGMQDRFQVHLREGEPCVRCGRTIVKFVVGGRGTYACERCQPRPRQVSSSRTRRAGKPA